jgi:hypothetical protein
MVVSSRAADCPVKEEALICVLFSELSRMALEMKAVSPFRSASTMRNFLTDDSSELALSAGLRDLPPAVEGALEGLRLTKVPETDIFELWPLMAC